MEWFSGTVEDAVQRSINGNKIFIVYIEGDDEESKKMNDTWKEAIVAKCLSADKSLAIRLKAGSFECNQFSQCYPLLCIPSTYLINQSGIPTDIVPGYLNAQDFVKKISAVLKGQQESADQGVENGNKYPASQGNTKECKSKPLGREEKKDEKLNKESAFEAVGLKIAQDKAEKKAKFEKQNEKNRKMIKKSISEAADNSTMERGVSRIQFRFANASTVTKEFPIQTKLSGLIQAISQVSGIENSNISLATVYPRRKFQENEIMLTLSELNLVPNAALIVVQEETGNITSSSTIWDFIKFVLAPIIAIFRFLKIMLSTQKNSSLTSPSSTAAKEKSHELKKKEQMKNNMKSHRKEGKVYTFRQDEDDDKEDKTWNGNSTQQM